jgi:hypothetical protein
MTQTGLPPSSDQVQRNGVSSSMRHRTLSEHGYYIVSGFGSLEQIDRYDRSEY